MTIYFKEVGQGDSIIFEWEENSIVKIGIIDCNKNGKSNPVIEHLNRRQNYLIEFIILSHPHTDHFSGMLELLQFLKERSIGIKSFFHTCASQKEYLQHSIRGINDKKILTNIFRLISEMDSIGLVTNYGFVNDLTSELKLVDDIRLKILAPSSSEYAKFNKKAFKNNSLLNNNPDANFLSTLIKVYNGKWFLLFTSDVMYDVFWRLNRDGFKFQEDHFLFGQIPHHGSAENYYPTFWRLINHNSKTLAIVSVGENSYGHPSKNVIDDLNNNSYSARLTNFNDSYRSTENSLSTSLDVISEKIDSRASFINSKDVILQINNGEVIEL